MNTILSALFAALLPVGLLVFYICRKDKDRPEPSSWMLKAGAYGVGSAILVIILALLHPSFLTVFPSLNGTVIGAIGEALFDAAIPEEAAKMLMLWLILRKNPYFDEYLDGIVYATCVGLGFAGLENIFYVTSNMDSLVSVAIIRAVFSVPGHFFYAVIMGYYISLACFQGCSKGRKRLYWILAFVVPTILHCIFDAVLMSVDAVPDMLLLLSIIFIAFCIWLRKYAIKHIAAMKTMDSESRGTSSTITSTVDATTIVRDYHAVFIDDGNTVYHYHNGELSLFRIDNIDTPFVIDRTGSFQKFVRTVQKSVDGNEVIFIYHNGAASDLNELLEFNPELSCPEIKFVLRTYSEVNPGMELQIENTFRITLIEASMEFLSSQN